MTYTQNTTASTSGPASRNAVRADDVRRTVYGRACACGHATCGCTSGVCGIRCGHHHRHDIGNVALSLRDRPAIVIRLGTLRQRACSGLPACQRSSARAPARVQRQRRVDGGEARLVLSHEKEHFILLVVSSVDLVLCALFCFGLFGWFFFSFLFWGWTAFFFALAVRCFLVCACLFFSRRAFHVQYYVDWLIVRSQISFIPRRCCCCDQARSAMPASPSPSPPHRRITARSSPRPIASRPSTTW